MFSSEPGWRPLGRLVVGRVRGVGVDRLLVVVVVGGGPRGGGLLVALPANKKKL